MTAYSGGFVSLFAVSTVTYMGCMGGLLTIALAHDIECTDVMGTRIPACG